MNKQYAHIYIPIRKKTRKMRKEKKHSIKKNVHHNSDRIMKHYKKALSAIHSPLTIQFDIKG